MEWRAANGEQIGTTDIPSRFVIGQNPPFTLLKSKSSDPLQYIKDDTCPVINIEGVRL